LRLYRTGDTSPKLGEIVRNLFLKQMANTHIEGRVVRIARPADVLYSLFTDLTNFTRNFPADMQDKADVRATPDTLLATVQGFEVGIKICERTPFTRIRYEQYGSTPIPFTFTVLLNDLGTGTSDFQLIMDSELSGMFKMMLGGKLQEIVDKVTDGVERALGV
jgi:hypothetical protein